MDKINKINTLSIKRNKRNKAEQTEMFHFGQQRNTRNKRPVGSCSCSDAPDLEKALALLKAEVLTYCNAYISRGIHAEGVALARLRKAAER